MSNISSFVNVLLIKQADSPNRRKTRKFCRLAHKRGPTRLPDGARSPRCDPVESLYLALYGIFSRGLVRWLLVSEQADTYQYTHERQ
jgi:hypothetical protein